MNATEALTLQESRLVAAIIEDDDATQEDLGRVIGKTSRYVRKLLSRPHVQEALDRAAKEGLRQAMGLLGRGVGRAARSLLAMATGAAPASAARVMAARAVLDLQLRLTEHLETERRLDDIEAELRRRGAPPEGKRWQ